MVKNSSREKTELKRGTWTPEEDRKLSAYIKRYGHWNWRELPKYAGLSRCGKSCRLRWMNYLRPNIKRGNYSREEEEIIINLHEKLGTRWSAIATKLPGRTDNEIKNHWHTHLKKRLKHHTSASKEEKPDQSAEISECKADKEGESEPNSPTPLILESSSVSPKLTQKCTYTDPDVGTGQNQVPNANINSSEILVESDGNFWTEPFLVGDDACLLEDFTSTLAYPELEFPFSLISLGEPLCHDDELLSNDSYMDFCFDQSR